MRVPLVQEQRLAELAGQHHLYTHCTVLSCTALYTVLFCTVLYCTTCFSNTSTWVSGGEKFLLKSRPHSPMATHSAHLQGEVM